MSTRGCVAVNGESPDYSQWRGVYNHSDSYPTGLGKEIWNAVHKLGLKAVVDGILNSGDWREFLSGGVCKYCGKLAGEPHSIRGDIYLAEAEGAEYPDPQAKYHEHGRGKEDQLTSDFPDPLYIEWLYILEPSDQTMAIFCPVERPLGHKSSVCGGTAKKRADGFWDYGHCVYKHFLVAVINLDGPEPNWEVLAQNCRRTRDTLSASYTLRKGEVIGAHRRI